MRKQLLALTALLVSSCALAEQIVELQDGRKIQLNDDFTWHYLPSGQAKLEAEIQSEQEVIKAVPVNDSKQGTLFTLGSTKPILQIQDSGVEVRMDAADYSNGELIIPTNIANQGRHSVILIEIEVEIEDGEGNLLTTQKSTVWQSIKRLADTYLRSEQSKQGLSLKLDVPKLEQYVLRAKVVNIETR